jgi:hypothetical protein
MAWYCANGLQIFCSATLTCSGGYSRYLGGLAEQNVPH